MTGRVAAYLNPTLILTVRNCVSCLLKAARPFAVCLVYKGLTHSHHFSLNLQSISFSLSMANPSGDPPGPGPNDTSTAILRPKKS